MVGCHGLVSLLTVSLCGLVYAQPASAPEMSSQQRREWNAKLRKREVDVDFSGVVKGPDGRAVAGAQVTIALTKIDFDSDERPRLSGDIRVLVTDQDGSFRLVNERVSRLEIRSIEKGVLTLDERSKPKTVLDFFELASKQGTRFQYRLRESHPTFLMEYRGSSRALPSQKTVVSIDLERGKMLSEADPTDGYSPDLAYECIFLPASSEYQVRFLGVKGSGIQKSDELLYEAPEDGYVSELKLLVGKDTCVGPVHLYVGSKGPELYSRIDVTLAGQIDHLIVDIYGIINPYGDRSLERAKELLAYPDVYVTLDNEARAAFRQNRKPQVPDLGKLVEAAEKRRQTASHPADGR